MQARTVLEDCRAALDRVDSAANQQQFRLAWVALVVLLRAVGHVLQKVDAASSAATRRAIDAKWAKWNQDPENHKIFWDFIECERNNVMKEYRPGTHPGDVEVVVDGAGAQDLFVLTECLFKPLLEGPFAGEDGRDVATEAIAWWEEQLTDIENDVNTEGT
jgi:hypothetical protein